MFHYKYNGLTKQITLLPYNNWSTKYVEKADDIEFLDFSTFWGSK